MVNDQLSRRDLFMNLAALGTVSLFGATGCSKAPLICTDTTGISPSDLTIRTSLAYVDVSTEATKSCATCQQFLPNATPNTCGTCKVLKGPINPKGYCKSFVAKPT